LKVRKRTDTVDAWYYDTDSRPMIIRILDEHRQEFIPFGKGIQLHTRDGELFLAPGDYLIKGKMGNFYNCKEDIFNATYEIVTETE
jgi:hypothetical protein